MLAGKALEPTLTKNVRLGRKGLVASNTLTYYARELITGIVN